MRTSLLRPLGPWKGLAGCVCLLAAAVWPFGCGNKVAAPPPEPAGPPVVRVLIRNDVEAVKLVAATQPVVRTSLSAAVAGDPRRLDIPSGASVPVTLGPGGWTVGAVTLGGGELTIEPERAGSVSIDGRAYRGHYRLVPATSKTFHVVNHVHIDGYLKGVLPRELYPEFDIEAYKAQAIVARTYALYEWKTTQTDKPWDLYDSTRSQVYGGMADESEKSRRAVDETAGVVVAHGPAGQEKIFKAYFSACCGGAGQSATDAFGEPHHEALTERSVGGQCSEAPRYAWGPVTVSREELTRRIRKYGALNKRAEKDIATVQRVDVARVNPSGRPTHLTVTDARGAKYMLIGEELRWAVNTDAPPGSSLYSSYVTPASEGSVIRFENGHGHGHGVGLCQWCAEVQARRGIGHEQIVLSAYRGAILRKAY
jgi:stage II sporulation protein D